MIARRTEMTNGSGNTRTRKILVACGRPNEITALREGIFVEHISTTNGTGCFNVSAVGGKPTRVIMRKDWNEKTFAEPPEVRVVNNGATSHVRLCNGKEGVRAVIERTGIQLTDEMPIKFEGGNAEIIGTSEDSNTVTWHVRLWNNEQQRLISLEFGYGTVSRAITEILGNHMVKVDGRVGEFGNIEFFVSSKQISR
ncbi:MAG: hypothetical protein ABIJ10_06775, partial [Candidatus Micrarchaeota archaeon]